MPRTDSAHRAITSSSEAAFSALVDEAARREWLPPSGMTGRFEHFDPRPGGGYRLILSYDDASLPGKSAQGVDVVDVRFTAVDAPHRVVEQSEFASSDPNMAGTMTITWLVEARSAGVLVTVSADNVPDGISRSDHAAGLNSSLGNLAAYLERGSTSA